MSMIQRPLVRLGLMCVVVAAACLLLAAAVWWDNAANRGIAGVAPSPPIPWSDVPRGGVNTYGLHQEVVSAAQRRTGDNKVAQTFQMIRDGGFHWVRVQFPWEDIEFCAKGDFVDCRAGSEKQSMWTKYDYIVEQARRNDLDLIVRLDRPPPWARTAAIASPEVQTALAAGYPVIGPPDRFEDYADFVGAVAARYKDDLRFYQIWNEPNLPGEWNYRRQDPAEFVRLLRLAGTAIKANDPDAVIIFPALSPTDGADGVATNDLDYLQGVYDAGGRDAFDIMSAQFYGLGQPPDEHRYITPGDHNRLLRPIETRADVSRVVLQHEIMQRNGDANKAVWVSELGWNSAPDGYQQPWGSSVSEQDKARYLVGAMERAQREWPWMGAMCVWMFRWGGEPPANGDPTPYFQLVDFDFNPLPAYETLRAYLTQTPALPLTQPSIWAVLATLVGVVAVVAATTWGWSTVLAFAGRGVLALSGATIIGAQYGRNATRHGARQVRAGWGRVAPTLWQRRIEDRWIVLALALALAFFYRASPQLPLTLVGAVVFIPLALWRPDLALLLVPLTVPLYLAPKGVWDARFGLSRPEGYFLPLHEFVLLIVVAGTALHHWRLLLNPIALLRQRERWVLPLLWLVAGTLGVVVAVANRGAALREWRWLIVEPLMLYALVLLYGRFAQWRWRMIWAWLIAGVAVAVIGILQVPGINLAPILARQTCFSTDVVAVEGVRRATSVYCHPNNLGLALGRVWPVLAALALAALMIPPREYHRRMTNGETMNDRLLTAVRRFVARFERRFGLMFTPTLLTVIVLVGIGASFSRGAIIGGVVAAVVLGVLLHRRFVVLAAGALVVLGLLAVLVTGIERFNPLGGSSSARLEIWGSALAMLRDHPLTGVGLDQFFQLRSTLPDGGPYITPEAAQTSERYAAHPHNEILDVLLRTGPFGLIVMVVLLVQFFRTAMRALRRASGVRRALVVGLLASMCGALVHGLIDNFYFVPDLAMTFWLHWALVNLLATDDPHAETTSTITKAMNDEQLMSDLIAREVL